ncbi:Fork head domain family protein [Acanthocheilonema viteae]
MHNCNEREELSSGDEMHNRAVTSTSNVQAIIDAAIREYQTINMIRSNTEAGVPLIGEQLGIRPNYSTTGLYRNYERRIEKVGWIGEPTFHPLALIQGPNGPCAISKELVLVGGDPIADVVVKRSSHISRCHFILYYTGKPNQWNIKVRSRNGILVNGIMYGQSARVRRIPMSCIFRFPSTSAYMLFCGMEPFPASGKTIFSIVRMTESEMNSAASVPHSSFTDAEMRFYLSRCHTKERTIWTSEQSEPIQIPSDRSAGANAGTGSPSTIFTSNSGRNCEDYEISYGEHSYAQLIVRPILSSPDQRSTENRILPTSICHNLSLNQYFVRVTRSQEEPVENSFWRMESSFASRNVELIYKKRKPKFLKGSRSSNFAVDNDPESAEGIMVPIGTSSQQVIANPEMCEEILVLNNSSTESISTSSSEDSFSDSDSESNSIVGSDSSSAGSDASDGDSNYSADRLLRPEFCFRGTTFRFNQPAIEGRTCLEPPCLVPNYRSVTSSKISQAMSSPYHFILNRTKQKDGDRTKSLSMTPVRVTSIEGSNGLKFEDLRSDIMMLSDSNESQYHQAKGEEAQPHHSNRHQNPISSAQAELFFDEKLIVASSAKAHSYTEPERQHSNSFDMQQDIGIKNYDDDAKFVVQNEITEENGYFMRKYDVDESVKLNASEIKRSSGDMLIHRKRTYIEAASDSGVQEEHKVIKKPRKIDEIAAHLIEGEMEVNQEETVDKEFASGSLLLTPPRPMKLETTIATNSNFLTQQFQTADHTNENGFYPNTVEADSVLNKLELAPSFCCAQSKMIRSKSYTKMSPQQQSNFVGNLNSRPQTNTSAATQFSDNQQATAMAGAKFASVFQRLLEKSDMPDTLQSTQPVNESVNDGSASQNLPSFDSLLSDAAFMTVISQLEAAAYMQYQLKIQQIYASAQSSEYLSNYVNYIRTLMGVPVSQNQSQSSNLFAPANEQRHQNPHESQPRTHSQFTFPNYSNLATLSTNPFLGPNLNLSIGQWFDYMRLLAVHFSPAGLYMSPVTTPLWNPLSMITLQNAYPMAPIFSNLQKVISDLMTQRDNDSIFENNEAQHPNYLGELLTMINNMSFDSNGMQHRVGFCYWCTKDSGSSGSSFLYFWIYNMYLTFPDILQPRSRMLRRA